MNSKFFPVQTYITFSVHPEKFDEFIKKIKDENVSQKNKLTHLELETLSSISQKLQRTSYFHSFSFGENEFGVIKKLLTWEKNCLNVILMVCRICLLHSDFKDLINEKFNFFIELTNNQTNLSILAFYLLCNTFEYERYHSSIELSFNRLVECSFQHYGNPKPEPSASLLFNLAIFCSQRKSKFLSQSRILLNAIVKFLLTPNQSKSHYYSLFVALGTLLVTFQIPFSQSIKDIISSIETNDEKSNQVKTDLLSLPVKEVSNETQAIQPIKPLQPVLQSKRVQPVSPLKPVKSQIPVQSVNQLQSTTTQSTISPQTQSAQPIKSTQSQPTISPQTQSAQPIKSTQSQPQSLNQDQIKKLTEFFALSSPLQNPVDQTFKHFEAKIQSGITTFQRYENPNILQEALKVIPVNILKERAKLNGNALPSEEDELIKQLLYWFKHEFFQWVDKPKCSFCQGDTLPKGNDLPNQSESFHLASIVEIYQCQLCGTFVRFPRYNDPKKLLETRSGRCGEWANCFTLLCKALTYEVRYILDFTDHVWTEVYSKHEKRWVHCDPSENLYDAPLVYEAGWNKQLSYIFGFSGDQVVDVMKRYTKNWDQVLKRRNLIEENKLVSYLISLNFELQFKKKLSQQRIMELGNRLNEERLQMENNLNTSLNIKEEETKGRISGSSEWKDSRKESGKSNSNSIYEEEDHLHTPDKLISFNSVFKFASFDGDLSLLSLVRAAKQFGNVIRLTPKIPSQVGALWFKKPQNISNGFQTIFKFQITDPGADGFAFVLQNKGDQIVGTDGCQIGFGGIPSSIAIEFDTYQSADRTLDPNGNHISVHSCGTSPNSAHHDYSLGCTTNFGANLTDEKVHICKITYAEHQLRIYFDNMEKAVLRVNVNIPDLLKLENGELFVGFTASTGGICENHDILSWEFYCL